MTSIYAESEPWTRGRWWGTVTLIFAAQLGLIFWLGDRRTISPKPAVPSPQIVFADNAHSEMIALDDPTLFALPNRRGFSGLAWLSLPGLPSQFFSWSESPEWLSVAAPQFRTVFERVAETNARGLPLIFDRPEPEPMVSGATAQPEISGRAVLRLEGGIAGRTLMTPITLQPQPAADLLTSSEVQVVVDPSGRVVSVPVLLAKSGSADADREALRLAGNARFNSINVGGPAKAAAGNAPEKLTWGRMIFEWRTIPMPATNSSSGP